MLKQTAFDVPAVVIVGKGLIVSVKELPMLAQPLPFVTLIVPVYVPAATFAATGIVTGLTGKTIDPVFTRRLQWQQYST